MQVVETIPTPVLVNNLVLVAKKDGRIRVCVDCTPANRVTRDFDWPLIRLQDVRHRTRGFSWFARFDLRDAFFRISIPAKFRYLTAFRAGGATYQFRKMPFGLKTAPATFQRFMDYGLAEFTGFSLCYLDDILIMGTSRQELEHNAREVRRGLTAMKCDINWDKSQGATQQILFAGIWVMGAGVGPNLGKFRELLMIPCPTTKAEAQSALGLVSYLRDFVPLVAHFTARLYPDQGGLTLPKAEYEREWARLLGHLVSAATTTRHWRDGVDANLYTDASGYALGAILLQEGRVVALSARKLTPAETRYDATDREQLGLVFAAHKFKLFLHQSTATTAVWTDHSALLTRKTYDVLPRQARWGEIVRQWMPNLRHVRGKMNPADFVSRMKGMDLWGPILSI